MAEIVIDDIEWKKGELGSQRFIIYDSDNVTRRNGSNKNYQFKFWKSRSNVLKGSGSLVNIDESNGVFSYTMQSGDTDTIDDYVGEIIEDPTGEKLRSNTFKVFVRESSDV